MEALNSKNKNIKGGGSPLEPFFCGNIRNNVPGYQNESNFSQVKRDFGVEYVARS